MGVAVMAEKLAVELETYRNRLPELMPQEGKFVLIAGKQLLGIYESYADALAQGYEKVGLTKPFLVKKIAGIETIAYLNLQLAEKRWKRPSS